MKLVKSTNPNKPLSCKNYGSIKHIRGSKISDASDKIIDERLEGIIFNPPKGWKIFTTEKMDGSNVGVGKVNGELVAIQRQGFLCQSSERLQHQLFVKYVEFWKSEFDELVNEGERITGEWLLQAHGMKYDIKDSCDLFRPFDIFTNENKRVPYQSFKEKMIYSIFEECKLISDKSNLNIDGLNHCCAVRNIEGVIFRAEKDGVFQFNTKYVRPDFEQGKYLPEVTGSEVVWNFDPNYFKLIQNAKPN